MLHSITKELTTSLTDFDTVFKPQVLKVVDFLKAPWMIERFKESCLASEPGLSMRSSAPLVVCLCWNLRLLSMYFA